MSAGRVFVTGGTGYIGRRLIPALPTRGFTVRALVRNPTEERVAKLQALHPNLVVVPGDLNDAPVIVAEAAQADIVINSASSDHWPSVHGAWAGVATRVGRTDVGARR